MRYEPDTHAEKQPQRHNRYHRMIWLPIPLLLVTMAVLWLLDIRLVQHQAWLDWLAHRAVPPLSILLIVIPAARTFLENPRPSVLMLGCGVLILQIGLALAPAAFAHNPNTAFTIYNTSALLAAVCHLMGQR